MSDEYWDAFFDELHAVMVNSKNTADIVTFGGACNYNRNVVCDGKDDCKKCAWNPAVDKARRPKTIKRAMEALQSEQQEQAHQ